MQPRDGLKRACAILLSAATAWAVSSCAALPSNTDPHVVRSYEPRDATEPVASPRPGSEPDLLLRDFFSASALRTTNFEAARGFLTSAAAEVWQPSETTIVVDRLNLNTLSGGSGERRSFSVQGDVIGELQPSGIFLPNRALYDATMELEQVNGEWRISSLPNGVIIERAELRNNYQPYNVYFLDAANSQLVADRRWVYGDRESLAGELLSMLVSGPATRLRPAVRYNLPAGAAYVGFEGGEYRFTGFSSMGEDDRLQFAAQVVWTLNNAGMTGPVTITADGDPLVSWVDEFTTADFANLDPLQGQTAGAPTYSLANGGLFEVSGGQAQAVSGAVGKADNIASADIARGGSVALVVGSEGDQRFELGSLEAEPSEVTRADNFTRPTFESDGAAAWVVADGRRVIRAVRSPATGEVSTSDITFDMPDGIDGTVSVLRLSRTGARVVMVIDGRLFTGVVQQGSSGQRSIVNVLEYAPDLGGTVIAADWNPDGSLLVGTNSAVAPVLRVEQDGSFTTTLSSGNLAAPVVAVASTSETYYVTDANAALQRPVSGAPDDPNWREVAGLQGVRSLLIVAR
ncbi:Lipoprotein LpqB precursor [Corynebacterium capitovis DSM 44611]|uniref:LpqB family beta-propeller domain-containing protein n=1 Tax=Corynebacterium capitovis TaxID=131081 RepID=UPI000364C56D|nr:LpqB family beta-propeller domain-containing protein [Corynebacterium capitovis]WKD57037.1 Lipoprotein LpqB precursor [Corynebacterium capitovis DSM 44611]